MRLVIQDTATGLFLHVHPQTGDMCWTMSLNAAIRFGVIHDEEQARETIADNCDRTAIAVDLDWDE